MLSAAILAHNAAYRDRVRGVVWCGAVRCVVVCGAVRCGARASVIACIRRAHGRAVKSEAADAQWDIYSEFGSFSQMQKETWSQAWPYCSPACSAGARARVSQVTLI